jgi:hypothetical protein
MTARLVGFAGALLIVLAVAVTYLPNCYLPVYR